MLTLLIRLIDQSNDYAWFDNQLVFRGCTLRTKDVTDG